MHDSPTMEKQLKNAPLQSIRDYANQHAIFGNIEYTNRDGSVMTQKQWYWAMKREEAFWDDMTAQIVTDEQSQLIPGNTLPQWLKDAARASFCRKKGIH